MPTPTHSCCDCCECCGGNYNEMMLWRKKDGVDTFTGFVQVYGEPVHPMFGSLKYNIYRLEDPEDIDGKKWLVTPQDFMREMQNYD